MRDLIYSDKLKIDVAKLDELNLHKEKEVGGRGGGGRGGNEIKITSYR